MLSSNNSLLQDLWLMCACPFVLSCCLRKWHSWKCSAVWHIKRENCLDIAWRIFKSKMLMNFEEKFQTKAKLNNALMPRGLSGDVGANKGGISRVVWIRCFKFFQDTFLVGVMWAPTDSTDRERRGEAENHLNAGLSQCWEVELDPDI